ncbi:24175_t:CDS:1 [Dentiscutata erythropus]|uniref:24175_t:CDS:1 n=1 Tax=Dentiscutata erythropus TaxID=1348616 RepID=A0A9N9P1E4_9GLOM|nr:24175_t:CDS:1 [Dentiscutata erythropus]
MEFTDDSKDEEQDDDQTNASEVRTSLSAPILLTHISNSSDNSKEEAWFDEDMYFNEVNGDNTDNVDRIKMPSNASITKGKANGYDNDVHFDEEGLKEEEGESYNTKSDGDNDSSDSEKEIPDKSDSYNDDKEGMNDANIFSDSTNKTITGDFTCSDNDEPGYYYDLSSGKKTYKNSDRLIGAY